MRVWIMISVAAACGMASPVEVAAAEGEVGVLAGVTRANVDDGWGDKAFEARHSGAMGASVTVALPLRFGVRVEAQWMTRGFDYSSRGGESHTARYLEMPVLLEWNAVGQEHAVSVYLLLGLCGGVRLHERTEALSCAGCSGITELPRLNAGAVGGGGLRVGRRLGVFAEARYARGLKKFGWDDGRWDGGRATTRDIQVLVGVTRRW